jgi:hypothetical protein
MPIYYNNSAKAIKKMFHINLMAENIKFIS